jgi:hypothetical protein
VALAAKRGRPDITLELLAKIAARKLEVSIELEETPT